MPVSSQLTIALDPAVSARLDQLALRRLRGHAVDGRVFGGAMAHAGRIDLTNIC